MNDWRQEALVRFARYPEIVEAADYTLWDFWSELTLALQGAYQQPEPDETLVADIYDYASWCFRKGLDGGRPEKDLLTHVVGFYENLASPAFYREREDMMRWISLDDFRRLYDEGAFNYFLTTREEQEAFAQDFIERKAGRKPTVEKPLPWKAFRGISSLKR